jgi:RNA polymerase sigma-70 factor (ECF subfamily)
MAIVDHSGAEQELLKRLRKGDVSAFDTLCLTLEVRLFSYVRHMLKDHCEAEDVTQEALLRLYVAAREGKVRSGPRAYAFSTAHNLVVDLLRRSRRSASPEGEFQDLSGPRNEASQSTEQGMLRGEIEKALATLPETQRSAVMLREFGQLNYGEIAQALGASLDQVKVWIYRARKHLAQVLDRYGQFIGDQSRGA